MNSLLWWFEGGSLVRLLVSCCGASRRLGRPFDSQNGPFLILSRYLDNWASSYGSC